MVSVEDSLLERDEHNPFLEPVEDDPFRSGVVFNAAAVKWDDGYLLLVRDQGAPGKLFDGDADLQVHVSEPEQLERWNNYSRSRFERVVLASDGHTVLERSEAPVMLPDSDFDYIGVEDPRATLIPGSDEFAVLYTGLKHRDDPDDGFHYHICLATTKDFHTFDKKGPVDIEGFEGVRNKDAFLFPEKVNGRYAMMHRPNTDLSMHVAYSDDLVHWDDAGIVMEMGTQEWEGEKIGANAPPIPTEHGWLVIYHGVDPEKNYRLGVAMLDADTLECTWRYTEPILSPDMPYEAEGHPTLGVPNVVFSCGAVDAGDKIWIPYGGADTVMCSAWLDKEKVLELYEKDMGIGY